MFKTQMAEHNELENWEEMAVGYFTAKYMK
jgi:hypothetical protein